MTIRESSVQKLHALATRQDGYFTAEQAEQIGFDTAMVRVNVATSAWSRVEHNLFRLGDWPHSDLEMFAMWCAWFGGDAVISHQSAAELYGLGHLHPQFVHLCAFTNLRSTDTRLAVHRLKLESRDVENTGTFKITTPLRTVLDLASGGISQITLDEVVSDAVAIGRVDPRTLCAESAGGTERVAERIELALAACS